MYYLFNLLLWWLCSILWSKSDGLTVNDNNLRKVGNWFLIMKVGTFDWLREVQVKPVAGHVNGLHNRRQVFKNMDVDKKYIIKQYLKIAMSTCS